MEYIVMYLPFLLPLILSVVNGLLGFYFWAICSTIFLVFLVLLCHKLVFTGHQSGCTGDLWKLTFIWVLSLAFAGINSLYIVIRVIISAFEKG